MAERNALWHRGHRYPHAKRISGYCTNSRADDNPFIGDDTRVKKGRHDRDGHAERGQLHATPGTVGTTQGAKSGDEQERCEQIRELDKYLDHDFTALEAPPSALSTTAVLVRLNIDSIRSVMRKPPTIF